MDVVALLLDLYGRIPPLAQEAVDGLAPADLIRQVTPGSNPVGWLVWHVSRVQDGEISGRFGVDQLWTDRGWAASFGLAPDPANHGYGHSPADVAAVQPESAAACVDYLDAVTARTQSFLGTMTSETLDEVIDRNWDPPVTLGVRLISVADDGLQHVGQANYLRGLLGL